ncbi:hypothetical protein G6F68_003904 [Rhizopus microsporus]|nr:hypothetical protein G6F68_003904 [Rhizopus microsporus]
MENNNNQSIASCSSCRAPLPIDSRHRTCKACRERVAALRRRRSAEDQQEEADVAIRPRGRPRRTVESVDVESRPRGRPRSDMLTVCQPHTSHSYPAFALWTLDVWTKSVPIATSCTGSMKGKRHLR